MLKTALAVVVALALVRAYVAAFGRVNGRSMEPTLEAGDKLVFEKTCMLRGGPARFDIAVFKAPRDPDAVYIKRVVGLPQEVIEVRSGRLVVNGRDTALPEGLHWPDVSFGPVAVEPAHYFVVGDNLADSVDSRDWGAVPRDYVLGCVRLRVWPATAMRVFKRESAGVKGAEDGDQGI